MRNTAIGFICSVLSLGVIQAKEMVNVDKTGLALQGYDPVAFFTEGKAVKGIDGVTTVHRGATYRFASEENKKAFAQAPDRYAPAYGGFCGYAVSRNYTAKVEIGTWQIIDGRVVLNYDNEVKALFDAEREANVKKADLNWPQLVDKQGK